MAEITAGRLLTTSSIQQNRPIRYFTVHQGKSLNLALYSITGFVGADPVSGRLACRWHEPGKDAWTRQSYATISRA